MREWQFLIIVALLLGIQGNTMPKEHLFNMILAAIFYAIAILLLIYSGVVAYYESKSKK